MTNCKEMSELKKRALLAKQRLRMGYWQRLERERAEMEKTRVDLDERGIEEIQRAQYRRDVLKVFDVDKAKRE